MLDPVYRVFALEELCRLICGFLHDRDAAKLLRLSRYTFASTASVIWEHVDLRQVLLLIPGTKHISTVGYNSPYPNQVFDLPTTMDLTRLKLYAPFVKRIHTSALYTINLPDQWKESRQATPHTPLFPNLLHLGLHTRGPICHEEVEWSVTLLGPKLRSFEAFPSQYGSNLRIEGDACCKLVTRMSEMCPCLEKLRVYAPRNSLLPLSSLKHLRSFTINEHGINDQVLQALGQLPHLERLTLFRDGLGRSLLENEDLTELPDDSFPSLRELSLNNISPFSIAQICTSPRLFRNLVVASIFYDINSCETSRGNLERLKTAVFPLGYNSPHITHLAIQLNGWFAPSWSIIEAFKHMPLRRLNLYSVVFGSEDYVAPEGEETPPVYHPSIGWRDFLAATPLLEELRLSRQTLEPNQLPIFACMLPRLRLLALRAISFVGTERAPDVTSWRPATQPITIQVNWYSMRLFQGVFDVSGVARYVYHLWPNVTFGPQHWAIEKLTADLNESIKSLRSKSL